MDAFFENLPNIAITVCDKEGKIIDMNHRSADVNSHGEKIIGNNLFNCHPERAALILRDLLNNEKRNAYTIEKNGIHKLIYQTPWYDNDGQYAGLVELSLEIPAQMPHYVRTPKPTQN